MTLTPDTSVGVHGIQQADSRLVVLHLIEGLGTGGAEGQLSAFLLRSDLSRFRHEVCTLAQMGRFAQTLESAGIQVHALGLRADGDMPRVIIHALRTARRVRPHILHATLFRPTIAARIVGVLTRTTVVTTLVNTAYEPEWRMDNPYLTPIKGWSVKFVDRLTAWVCGGHYVAITSSVRESAIRQLGLNHEQITVIPRGLSFDGGEQASPGDARAGLGDGEDLRDAYPLVLNVGRLVPQKGQRYLILAMRHIVSRFPRARLMIAGEGWLRPTLERLIEDEGLTGCVRLLGERRDVGRLLHAADIFAFPSLFEGLGNAVLEAMAAGKPCVVSRIPALMEITGNGQVAMLVDPRSSKDMAAGILRLAESGGLAGRLGEDARAWTRTRFRIENSVAALEALYQGLAASAPVVGRQDRVLPSGDPQ